jgi:hypothetical protein
MRPLFILAFLINLVHKIKTDLMLKTVHTRLLLHLPAFHTLSENISLTQYVVVGGRGAVIHWAVVKVVFGMLACLGIDRRLIEIHHVVDAV